jgi:ATP-dependent DNA helicase RecQ
LHYHVIRTRNDSEKDATLIGLLRTHPGQAVVYATTRKAVDRITEMLEAEGFAVRGYHAGQEDHERRTAQNEFMVEQVNVIVATSAFGMGIDKANVRLVVHYAMPGSLEAYYQEAGRAGRNGQRANCIVLHAFQDRFTHEFFINNPRPMLDERREVRSDRRAIDAALAARRRRAELDKLDTMQRYAYARGCRRTFSLRYFGDAAASGRCDGCDNCLGNHRPALAAETRAPRRRSGSGTRGRPSARPSGALLSDGDPGSRATTRSPTRAPDHEGPLFTILRSLRSELARRDGVPAFVVFPDRTLVEIAARRPQSLAALADVRGVGPVKLGRYGEQVLAAVRAHDRGAPTRA